MNVTQTHPRRDLADRAERVLVMCFGRYFLGGSRARLEWSGIDARQLGCPPPHQFKADCPARIYARHILAILAGE